ncbi:pyridoxine 5'-phosphate synthase, partial [Vibrio sp. 704]|uniref:pyridoxine 5'-phosphate synthase n=1 Tax=Vibrio sp. 704 TaxID=3074610 RepID=UPI002964FAC2
AQLKKIAAGASYAYDLCIIVNAGHGLTYHNVAPIAALPEIYELNIGHSIIGRAVFDGLEKSVAEMKALMIAARK